MTVLLKYYQEKIILSVVYGNIHFHSQFESHSFASLSGQQIMWMG